MSECPVCYELVQSSDILLCTHKVHIGCIKKSMKAECPLCRIKLPNIKANEKLFNEVMKEDNIEYHNYQNESYYDNESFSENESTNSIERFLINPDLHRIREIYDFLSQYQSEYQQHCHEYFDGDLSFIENIINTPQPITNNIRNACELIYQRALRNDANITDLKDLDSDSEYIYEIHSQVPESEDSVPNDPYEHDNEFFQAY